MRYRINYDDRGDEWKYEVQRHICLIWWPCFRTRCEKDAISIIQERMAKKFRPKKQFICEYTEKDYLVDKLKDTGTR
jgi:hypothetical protein